MKSMILTPANLHLFDGAAAGDGAASGESAAAGGAAPAGKKAAAETRVVYGKQPETSGGTVVTNASEQSGQTQNDGDRATTPSSDTMEARRKAYRELVSGEYKDLYEADTQRMIDRRFRETKTLQETVGKYQPVIDMLASRYGINDGDMESLVRALDEDDALWQEAADEAGMSVRQYKAMQKLERENKALIAAQKQREGEQRANAQLEQWSRESEELRKKYPNFNLQQEAQNPQFVAMLRSNVPIEHAYKVIHMDELMSGAVQQAAVVTEQRVAASIRAKGQRPAEAGLGAQSGVVVKSDVNHLTKADRAEIARRAARGEKITF